MTTNLKPRCVPPLDPDFRPALLANRNCVGAAKGTGQAAPLVTGLERECRLVSSHETSVFPETDAAKLRSVKRTVKFMTASTIIVRRGITFCAVILCSASLCAESPAPQFKVVAFYTTPANESAHVTFALDANRWFPQMGIKYNFSYQATTNWNQMNTAFLSQYQVVLFLDSRPENPDQRRAFEDYMDHGGAWMGFHFAGFSLTPSEFPQNWDWYHQKFLGSGEFLGNSWPPSPAVLRVEDTHHPATRTLPVTFKSAPSEWYRWKHNLRANPDIKVLLSIDPTSFPLGTSLKTNETWHSGDYPVVWTNLKYKMIYMNMGHDDLDYQANPHKQLSSTFDSEMQNRLILQSLLWLGGGKGP